MGLRIYSVSRSKMRLKESANVETAYGNNGQIAAFDVVQPELSRDEKLLWAGQPSGGIRLQPEDIISIPFSLVWAGFAFFWEFTVFTTGAPFFLKLWGIPFVLIGCYMVFGRFVLDAIQRKHTYYGVTNQRVVIITTWLSKNIQSIMLPNLPDITLRLRGESKGTITFGSTPFGALFSSRTSWPGARRAMPPAFNMIPGAREVYDIIKQAELDLSRSSQHENEWSRTAASYGREEYTGSNTRAL